MFSIVSGFDPNQFPQTVSFTFRFLGIGSRLSRFTHTVVAVCAKAKGNVKEKRNKCKGTPLTCSSSSWLMMMSEISRLSTSKRYAARTTTEQEAIKNKSI